MLGAHHSSVALVATAVAERQGIPFLVGDSVALNITGRGFKWIFRAPVECRASSSWRRLSTVRDRPNRRRSRRRYGEPISSPNNS